LTPFRQTLIEQAAYAFYAHICILPLQQIYLYRIIQFSTMQSFRKDSA